MRARPVSQSLQPPIIQSYFAPDKLHRRCRRITLPVRATTIAAGAGLPGFRQADLPRASDGEGRDAPRKFGRLKASIAARGSISAPPAVVVERIGGTAAPD